MAGIRICFVAHNAYAALTEQRLDHVGGIERQQAMMARWLASNGHNVSMITWAQNEPRKQSVPGIQVQFLCKRSDGLPVFRFFYPRWFSLIQAMSKVDADIYYYNLGDLALGQIVAWSIRSKKTIVYSVASESVCKYDLRGVLSLRERLLYRFGVRHVNDIIVQTNAQSELLRTEYGRGSHVLPMPCPDLSGGKCLAKAPLQDRSPRVLWIGRLSREKRPMWILDIAQKCPDVYFDVVGQANRDTGYSREFLDRAQSMQNVIIHGVVEHQEISRFYRNANALLCTSEYEGFPNVFLEAWCMGLPTLTTFDPDSIVTRKEIGFVGLSVDELIAGLKHLMSNESVWSGCAINARSYFAANHDVDHAMPGFVNVLRESIENKGAGNPMSVED